MQERDRGTYNPPHPQNRIYKRKYDIDVEPSYNVEHRTIPATTTHYDMMARQNYTQMRSQQGWQAETRSYQASERVNSYTTGQNQVPTVSNFKGSRQDELLKKLEMYEQKYNLGSNMSKQPNRKAFDGVQFEKQYEPISRESLPIHPMHRQQYYSTNGSPKKEQIKQQYGRPEAPRYNERRNSQIGIPRRTTTRYQQNEPDNYTRQNREVRYQQQNTYQRPIHERDHAADEKPIDTTLQSYQPPRIDLRQNERPTYDRPLTSNQYNPSDRARSITQNTKLNDNLQQYRPSLRVPAAEYRQTGKLSSGAEGRNYAYRQRRQREDTQTQQDPIYITENTENDLIGRVRQPLQERDLNYTEKSYWEEEQPKKNIPKPRDLDNEREDRLRNIKSKVAQADQNNNYHLERSEKKQSLRERSEQLRQKMNEPSPLKNKFPGQQKTDRQNKENIEIQEKNQRNPKMRLQQKAEDRRRLDPQTREKELTPSKASRGNSKEKRLEFEEDTYRKIETINDLNNKINERIKHILSSFNQETC